MARRALILLLSSLLLFLSCREKGKRIGETARLDLYIMSLCPYGQRAVEVIEKVVPLFPDTLELKLYFIVEEDPEGGFDSLHGDEEVEEDLFEACLFDLEPGKFFEYHRRFRARVTGESPMEIAEAAGVDWKAVEKCLKSGRGERLLKEHAERVKRLEVYSSPTLFINGVEYRGRVTSLDLFNTVCNTFDRAWRVPPCNTIPGGLSGDDGIKGSEGCGEAGETGVGEDLGRRFTLISLYHPDSVFSPHEEVIKYITGIINGIKVKRIAAGSEEGRRLIDEMGIEIIPFHILRGPVDELSSLRDFRDGLVKAGEEYYLEPFRFGANFFLKRERHDGEVSLFISPLSEIYGGDGMKEVANLIRRGSTIHYILYRDRKGSLSALFGKGELEEIARLKVVEKHWQKRFIPYLLEKGGEMGGSYWEEPLARAGIPPERVKEMARGDEGKRLLEEEALLNQAFKVMGEGFFMLENREVIGFDSMEAFSGIVKRLEERGLLKKESSKDKGKGGKGNEE